MSRALAHRLQKLEALRSMKSLSSLVVIPWKDWPENEEAWEAVRMANPGGRVFIPGQAESLEAWQQAAGR